MTEKTIEGIFNRFEGRIHYVDGYIYVRNFSKYQLYKNHSTKQAVDEELKGVPLRIKQHIAEIDKEYAHLDGENGRLFSVEELKKAKQENKDKEVATMVEVQAIFSYYKLKINDNSRLTKQASAKIASRLKEYEVDELRKAIDNFAADEWRMENNSDKGIQWFFDSEDKVAKWLQLKASKSQGAIKV